MRNMGKIRDILMKCSCTVTEKPTLKLPELRNMASTVFMSYHIYYTYVPGPGAKELRGQLLQTLQIDS